MPEIFNGKRSGSMSDRRSTATSPTSDVRSGSLADVTEREPSEQPKGEIVRYRIVSRDGRLVVESSRSTHHP